MTLLAVDRLRHGEVAHDAEGSATYTSDERQRHKPQPMTETTLRQLRLTCFRSYKSAQVDLDGRSAVLTGPNGAGKTNLLEAISLLGPGRGLRSARLQDLSHRAYEEDKLQDLAAPWVVSATLHHGGDELRIGTGLEFAQGGTSRRIVRINGETVSGPSSLGDYLSFVWLTPVMDRLFLEGASQRRRFVDRLVLSFDAAHSSRVNSFDKVMRERQKLLEMDSWDETWIASLETTMAEQAIAICAARLDYVEYLQAEIDSGEVSTDLFPRGDLTLQGELEDLLRSGKSALDVEDIYQAALKDNRHRDAAAGRAIMGPHRSDLQVTHKAKAMPAKHCSTGEQKAILVGLVLANARLKGHRRDHRGCILLLDEIAAHLDPARRQALFDEISAMGVQAFMTGTDQELFAGLGGRAQFLNLDRKGNISLA